MNTPLQKRRKATQRERLLAGVIAVANREGYAGASVSEVIAEAGVSRPTFYEYFADRDAAFIAAIADVHKRLHKQIRGAIAGGPPQASLSRALAATVAFARAEPAGARFLTKESLAGGPGPLDERDRSIARTAKLIEGTLNRAPADAQVPDVPVAAVLGAAHRLIASRLRRGERGLVGLDDELSAWVESYARALSDQRWRGLRATAAPERSPYLPPTTLRPPPKLGPGRPRLSVEEVAENHRQRIIFATARVVQESGYNAATIERIMRVAGVEGRAFYGLFNDKQDAFSAIHEVGFQYLMATTAGAFFAGKTWPERIWEAFRAAAQSVEETPAFAHVAFVEAYAVGPRGIQRVEDSRAAFTIFLQEGYRHLRKDAAPPSRLALEAIITTIFEIVYLQTRASATPKTAGLLGHIVHMCLAPFIGVQAADQLIAAESARTRPRARI